MKQQASNIKNLFCGPIAVLSGFGVLVGCCALLGSYWFEGHAAVAWAREADARELRGSVAFLSIAHAKLLASYCRSTDHPIGRQAAITGRPALEETPTAALGPLKAWIGTGAAAEDFPRPPFSLIASEYRAPVSGGIRTDLRTSSGIMRPAPGTPPITREHIQRMLNPYRRATLYGVILPLWVPVLIAILPIALPYRRWRQNARRFSRGLCVACGYDLRASPRRCPECGLDVAVLVPTPYCTS
jgi:hypothetical protein